MIAIYDTLIYGSRGSAPEPAGPAAFAGTIGQQQHNKYSAIIIYYDRKRQMRNIHARRMWPIIFAPVIKSHAYNIINSPSYKTTIYSCNITIVFAKIYK